MTTGCRGAASMKYLRDAVRGRPFALLALQERLVPPDLLAHLCVRERPDLGCELITLRTKGTVQFGGMGSGVEVEQLLETFPSGWWYQSASIRKSL